jgi:asparagine synthase (glutamine-hydrolysing)
VCGIAGVLGLGVDLGEDDLADLRRMMRVLRHRGPDQHGELHHPRCLLGNARLAVIDPSERASLPMTAPDGAISLAYNGEIANFQELRLAHGLDREVAFQSRSDAEVLLHLYRRRGIAVLNELSGMFAFGLYDGRRQVAHLARDFYGISPLFTMQRGERFYFASEINALLQVRAFRRLLDHEGFHHYFSLGYLPGRHTPWADISELLGGERIEVDLARGRAERVRYHEIEYRPDPTLTEREAAARALELMRAAVRRNLVADVPVGVMLSGGIDSSAILQLAHELGHPAARHTFGLSFGDASFDESRFQRVMAARVGARHHDIRVEAQDIERSLHPAVAHLAEPLADGSAIPLYLLAREASRHVRVLLSGEGGDEIFNAYDTHVACRARSLYRACAPPVVRGLFTRGARRLPVSRAKLSFDFRAKRFTAGAELSVPEAHLFWRHILSEEQKRALMPRHQGFGTSAELFVRAYEALDFRDDLDRLAAIDLRFGLVGDLLLEADRMLFAHSVEGRYPLLDRQLVEFAATVPSSMKVRWLRGRRVQKRALRGHLPREILRRGKFGMEIPYSRWLRAELRPLAERYLCREVVERTEHLYWRGVAPLWEEHLAGRCDHGRALWSILCYLVWFESYMESDRYLQHLASARPA